MKKKILVVDNDPFFLELMTDLLEIEGYQVLTAINGIYALAVLESYIPDVIFLDMIMPNIDGKKLCQIIQRMPKLKNTYLVILSAIAAEEINLTELKANAYIVKDHINKMAPNILAILNQSELTSSEELKGKITGLKDIHSHQITKELLSVKRHFELILGSMTEGILEITPDKRIVYTNSTAVSMLGIPEEKLLYRNFLDLLTPSDREKIEGLLETAISGTRAVIDEPPLNLNDKMISMNILPLKDDEHKTIIVLNDISERKQVEEALQRRSRELALLNQASREFNSTLYLDEVLVTVLEKMRILLTVAATSIWLIEPETKELVCRHSTGQFRSILTGWRMKPGLGLAGWVVQADESVMVPNAQADPRHFKEIDQQTGWKTCSVLAVPLRHKKNILGVIEAVDPIEDLFKPEDLSLAESLAASAANAIENARLYTAVQQDLTERTRAEENLQHTLGKLREATRGTIQLLASTVEVRDPYTAGHQQRVADLARSIATGIGLSEKQIDGIRLAGIIHDIGKISVPAEILSKPGRLSDSEFSIIRDHPQVGYDILKNIEFPWPIAQIVHQHHEKINGSGYPQGLSGEDILTEARILCVADVVEAMASHRPYRPSLGIDKALEEISEQRGILYDPNAVDACLELFTEKKFQFQIYHGKKLLEKDRKKAGRSLSEYKLS